MICIDINNKTDFVVDEIIVKKIIFSLNKNLNINKGSVSLGLVNNSAIQVLNKKYFGIDEPTDVLSFPENEVDKDFINKFEKDNLIGEIIIAVDVMKSQAIKYGCSQIQEFARLFIHGFLHLIGYDHQNEKEHIRMKLNEEKILKDIFTYD